MPQQTVVMIGDSTIDNYVWVQDGETVAEKLKLLRPEDNIISFAVDGFTTTDVLAGNYTNKAVSSDKHNGDFFKPLSALNKLAPQKPKKKKKKKNKHNTEVQSPNPVDHIILSVGGNDFREELRTLITMSADYRAKAIDKLSSGISQRYIRILSNIQDQHPQAKITTLLQYTPNTTNDAYFIYFLMSAIANKQTMTEDTSLYLSGIFHHLVGLSAYDSREAVEVLHDIMERVYRPILQEFITRNISVVDLASSFNEKDASLYVSQIEPSAKGSELIANLISEILDSPTEQSILISKPLRSLETHSLMTPIENIAHHWRPGHVYSNSAQAIATFLNAYNQSRQTKKFNLFSHDKVSDLQNKNLNELISDVQLGRASTDTIKVMQKLKFLDYKGNFTNKSAVYNFVSEEIRASTSMKH